MGKWKLGIGPPHVCVRAGTFKAGFLAIRILESSD
jgi:hypothetical protein